MYSLGGRNILRPYLVADNQTPTIYCAPTSLPKKLLFQ